MYCIVQTAQFQTIWMTTQKARARELAAQANYRLGSCVIGPRGESRRSFLVGSRPFRRPVHGLLGVRGRARERADAIIQPVQRGSGGVSSIHLIVQGRVSAHYQINRAPRLQGESRLTTEGMPKRWRRQSWLRNKLTALLS